MWMWIMDEVCVATHQNSGRTFALLQQCRRLRPSSLLAYDCLLYRLGIMMLILMLSSIPLACLSEMASSTGGRVPSSSVTSTSAYERMKNRRSDVARHF